MTSPSAERTGIDGFGIASLVLGMQGCYPSRDFSRPLWHCCLVTVAVTSRQLATCDGRDRARMDRSDSWSDRDVRLFRAPRGIRFRRSIASARSAVQSDRPHDKSDCTAFPVTGPPRGLLSVFSSRKGR
jgi:hypothetical protein